MLLRQFQLPVPRPGNRELDFVLISKTSGLRWAALAALLLLVSEALILGWWMLEECSTVVVGYFSYFGMI